MTQHRFRSAIPLARRALRLAPDSTVALGALGDALVATGRYDAGFRVYDRLAGIGPSVGAYARVATARHLLGRPAAALDAMELAIEAGSAIPEQEAWALTRYGTLLVASNRLEDADAAFGRALRLSPGYVHARAGHARVAAARGRFGEASERLQAWSTGFPSRSTRSSSATCSPATVARSQLAERMLSCRRSTVSLRRTACEPSFSPRSSTSTGVSGCRQRSTAPERRIAPRRGSRLPTPSPGASCGKGAAPKHAAGPKRALALGTKDGLFLFHRGMIERCLRW